MKSKGMIDLKNKERNEILNRLILAEINYRKKWRESVEKLQNLVDPVTIHNLDCCNFWNEYFPDVDDVILQIDDKTVYRIKRPVREVAMQEAYLPYGIDFTVCDFIDVSI